MSLNIHRMINILHFNRHYSQQFVFHTFCSEFGQSFLYYNMQTVLELESRIFKGRRSALICIDITVESWRGTNEVDDGQWPSGYEVNAAQALGVNALQRAPTEKKSISSFTHNVPNISFYQLAGRAYCKSPVDECHCRRSTQCRPPLSDLCNHTAM